MTLRPSADLEALILAWDQALTSAGVPPCAGADSDRLSERLARATGTVPTSTLAAERLGAELARMLVDADATTPAVVWHAVLLVGRLPLEAEILARVQSALTFGHSMATQRRLLAQQEAIHQAAIIARDRVAVALRESEARFRALFGQAPVGIGIGDTSGRILDANDALQRMFGYSLAEFQNSRVEDFMHQDDAAQVWQDYAALVAGDLDEFRTEKRYLHKDGHIVWTNLSVSLVRGADDEPVFQVAVMEDVTERHQLQEQLLHEATHDSLTGLPNRALFLQQLDAAIASPEAGGQIAVLFLDLDGFKFVNDSRGHLVGDRVLTAVARRLAKTAAKHAALLARLAGDEFVVLLTGQAGRLQQVAEDLLAALASPIQLDDRQSVHVRASAGVVELPVLDANADELLRAADLALHAAKEDGRGQVVAHDPRRTAHQLTNFTIAMNLPGVVERGELALAYQPLVRLNDGGLHSVEALLRWNHPQLGELSPDLFIRLAEENSAIIPIGRWVLDQACLDLAGSTWPTVNINASVRQLYSPTFVEDIRRALDRNQLSPEQLRIEITESVIMHDSDPGPLASLRVLADSGVRIVMDDFGTGYSNLAALRRFPLHELKLAGTFLKGLGTEREVDAVDLKILATLVDLAHSLGLVVTAEGVETPAQDERVRTIGCDIGQGWYYGSAAPLPWP
ncbi:MAG TPA: EAL domain-containing protein [Kineosporiaceae bacterium]|nr:EAL domain-containing protein [Kineosporiaceae bacterium]